MNGHNGEKKKKAAELRTGDRFTVYGNSGTVRLTKDEILLDCDNGKTFEYIKCVKRWGKY